MGETAPKDKAEIKAGEEFSKAWTIRNTGTCTWDEGYVFFFLADISSPELKGDSIVIRRSEDFTKPGHDQSFVVKLKAPNKPGEYISYWKLKDDAGNFFGPRVYVDIIVK